ncbi:MAG: hypothetical protein IKJ81_02645 [Bacteroidales bacterium]|nr:hypothetical protein [Bacteroidales bacterium]
MQYYKIKYLLKEDVSSLIDTTINVKGWVRTKRGNKNVAFIALNDGSIITNLQIVVDLAKFDDDLMRRITTGACIGIDGKLVKSQGAGQAVEVQAENIVIYGEADPETYPLQKKGHSMEFLREIAHLRPRTNTFGAVLRMRHEMAYAIHTFFHQKCFYYFHTPLITASYCEGVG